MFFMMVCFEVFYFEFTINLPPPTGGGLVQRLVYEALGIPKHFPVKPLQILLSVTPFKLALSAQ